MQDVWNGEGDVELEQLSKIEADKYLNERDKTERKEERLRKQQRRKSTTTPTMSDPEDDYDLEDHPSDWEVEDLQDLDDVKEAMESNFDRKTNQMTGFESREDVDPAEFERALQKEEEMLKEVRVKKIHEVAEGGQERVVMSDSSSSDSDSSGMEDFVVDDVTSRKKRKKKLKKVSFFCWRMRRKVMRVVLTRNNSNNTPSPPVTSHYRKRKSCFFPKTTALNLVMSLRRCCRVLWLPRGSRKHEERRRGRERGVKAH